MNTKFSPSIFDRIYAHFRILDSRLGRQLIIDLKNTKQIIDEIEGQTDLSFRRYQSIALDLIEEKNKVLLDGQAEIGKWLMHQRERTLQYKKRIKDEQKLSHR